MRGGAGTGPGRECAALMSDLRAGDSFDMLANFAVLKHNSIAQTGCQKQVNLQCSAPERA
jgi:hypothetical protein